MKVDHPVEHRFGHRAHHAWIDHPRHRHALGERGVLHDQGIRVDDGLAQADLAIVDAAEGHHRRAGALRAEAGKRLRVAALVEGRDGQHVGGGDHPLAAAAVDSYLQHGVLQQVTSQ